ncbi:hypothetical protein L1857_13520 [Amycolatopsis thermalba]|uniref:DUF4189 domain-containing protein n=1 Tax=Amycolatopsis thermalba TaxID=944492 RepID=A0ABY4NUN6_9PSEU|nr:MULTISPECIES: hypothetical protein [Amycolatopsis]UQS23776.1 hypothetical protein L1857_13520 [Amycolatopsis thermalba]
MRSYHGALLIGAALAGCAGGSPIPGEQPADSPAEVTTTETAGTGADPTTTRTSKSEPPGVPGSPIDYDSTLLLAGVAGARAEILATLREECGPGLCGVKVVVSGRGECAASIGPDPVLPGGTITIRAKPCETTEETTAAESTPDTAESGG